MINPDFAYSHGTHMIDKEKRSMLLEPVVPRRRTNIDWNALSFHQVQPPTFHSGPCSMYQENPPFVYVGIFLPIFFHVIVLYFTGVWIVGATPLKK
jgi:hypothetical protein